MNCKETSILLSKKLDNKLSVRNILLLNLHLLICKNCRICKNNFSEIEKGMKLIKLNYLKK